MPTEEKKGITVKVDAALHAEVRQYLESHGMTMAEFVTLALQDELHPKIQMKEDAGSMRTLAFQVPDDLFRRIKEYLQRNNMTQKEFIIGLIEQELTRDMAEREGVNEAQADDSEQSEDDTETEENAAVDDFEADSGEDESEDESEEYGEDESEDEDQGFSMGMGM